MGWDVYSWEKGSCSVTSLPSKEKTAVGPRGSVRPASSVRRDPSALRFDGPGRTDADGRQPCPTAARGPGHAAPEGVGGGRDREGGTFQKR